MDDKLAKLNEHLATRSFLVGCSVTVADLLVYGLVQQAAVGLPAAQAAHFASLLRWVDQLQNTADAGGFFAPRLALAKPRYVPPPPPPPPPPKAAPAAAVAPGPGEAKGGADAAASAGAPKGKAAPDAKKPKPEAAAPPAPAAPAASPAAAPAPAASPAAAPAPSAAGAEAGAAQPAEAGGKEAGAKKKDKGAAGPKKEAAPPAKAAEEEASIDLLDCRVGRIVKVEPHPNADALYLEQIDLGEDKPRQVISGLRNFVPIEQMQDRVVVVVCNLKPAKMRDVMSYGMVLCASDDAHGTVEPVRVPEGVPLGERLTVEGFTGSPVDEINPKRKILERLFPDMKTDGAGTPVFKGKPFLTSKGALSSSVQNGWVK